MNDPYCEEAPLVDPSDFSKWIVQEDDNLLIINKPGWLVCHPSKNGPMSSLVGVVREYTGLEKIHLVARLDRETSGLVIFSKRPSVARKFQMAIQKKIVKKIYIALLEGELTKPTEINLPIGKRIGGPVIIKSEVSEDRNAQSARTNFIPMITKNGYTLCNVMPETGRKHQIRAHAEHIERRIVGDKIYGPDETLYIEFIEQGWTPRLEAALPIKRQGLHCYRYDFKFLDGSVCFTAPVQDDMLSFCHRHMGLNHEAIETSLTAI